MGRRGARLNPDPFNPTVIGLSVLGNNSVEAQTSPIDAPVTDLTPREVPLVFDSITGTYCSPLDRVNQEERLEGLEVANLTADDQRFLSAAGFTYNKGTPPIGFPVLSEFNPVLDDNGNPILDDDGNVVRG